MLEARFSFGSGYGVYFSVLKQEIVLLLIGGDKSTQECDVSLSKEFLKSYLEDMYADKKQ